MLGILNGLMITIKHALKPKLTQLYPYKKPDLPERSRGLIQLITEKETGVLRCEACLLCEKVCPPRAITISYQERGAFRRRPLLRPRTVNGFYRHRLALTAPYEGKLVPSAVDVSDEKVLTDTSKVDAILTRALEEGWDLMTVLTAVQDAFGYVSQAAAKRVSETMEIDMANLYAIMTMNPALRPKAASSDPDINKKNQRPDSGGNNG